jgi:hypothetical protein
MKIGRREPVTLRIELINQSNEPKMLSLEVRLGRQLSFEKSGYRTEQTEKIPTMQPAENKVYYYDVFPKANTRSEEQPIVVKVAEHYQNFNYVTKEYTKNLALRVED